MPGGTANPSGLLAESLATLVAGFSRSAHQAFAQVESQARQDIIQAHADTREARRERDNALETLHASQLQVQALQLEIADVRAALKQSELSLSHHKETSAHLRREATQWKDQSLNWQDNFLRVEQEKCTLKTRIEELVAEQSQWSQTLPTPFTPSHPAPDNCKPVSLSNRRSVSTVPRKHPISPPDVDVPAVTVLSSHKSNRLTSKPVKLQKQTKAAPTQSRYSEASSTSDRNVDHQDSDSPTRERSKTKVIRRVRAIIDVKQEESDEEPEQLAVEDGLIAPSKRHVPPRKRKAVNYDEHCPSDEEDISPPPEDQSYDQENEEQDIDDDDDDDELMLGADNAGYSERSPHPKNFSGQSLSASPSKKRRLMRRDKATRRKT